MQLNPEIRVVLKQCKIDVDDGILCLLGIYHGLDVERTCAEETIKGINLTKIVEKDYNSNTYKWNMPLYDGEQTEFGWVKDDWNTMWSVNITRKDSNPIVTKRMKDWFAKYPQYRKEDVMKATQAYFHSLRDLQYLKSSAKFIFENNGAMKDSMLLAWCEKTASNVTGVVGMKGKIA